MGDMETTVDDVTTDVDTGIDTTDDLGNDTDEWVALLNKYKIDPENFTQDDLVATLKRLNKAEEAKRQDKKKKESSEPTTKYLTEADLERRDFLKANPELNDYTKDWEEKVKKGYTFEDAKLSILNSDKARTNREKLNSLGLSDWEATSKKSSYTMSELDKLASNNPQEYARVRNEMDAGKIKMSR